MTTKKSLKSALVVSGLSMLLCGAMLAGTTFAWFSDTATSGENTIVAGNLQVQLQYDANYGKEGGGEDWQNAETQPLFSITGDLEPGMMFVSTPFRIANMGNLALDYTVSLDFGDEEGESPKFSEVIQWLICPLETYSGGEVEAAERSAIWSALQTSIAASKKDYTEGTLTGSGATSDTLVCILYWPSSEQDNSFNKANTADKLSTTLKLSVYAKQSPSERDGVDETYDSKAE